MTATDVSSVSSSNRSQTSGGKLRLHEDALHDAGAVAHHDERDLTRRSDVVTHPRTVTIRPTSLLNPLMRVDANVIDLTEVTFGERKLWRRGHECQRGVRTNDRTPGTKSRGCGYSTRGRISEWFGWPVICVIRDGCPWRSRGRAASMEYMNGLRYRAHTSGRRTVARPGQRASVIEPCPRVASCHVTLRSKLALGLVANLLILSRRSSSRSSSLEQLHDATRAAARPCVRRVAARRANARDVPTSCASPRSGCSSCTTPRRSSHVNAAARAQLRAMTDSLQGYDLETCAHAHRRADREARDTRAGRRSHARESPAIADTISTRQYLPARARDRAARCATRSSCSRERTTIARQQRDHARRQHDRDLGHRPRRRGERRAARVDRALAHGQPAGARSRGRHGGRGHGDSTTGSRCHPRATTSSAGWPTSYKSMAAPARGARQAQGGVRVRRVARAQDADQRHHRLSAAAQRRRVRIDLRRSRGEILRNARRAGAHAVAARAAAARRQPLRGRRRQARASPDGARPLPRASSRRTFHVLAIQRGIHFRVDRARGPLPAEVVWDPDRINEVLGNLLSNAFKFTTQGGTVELRRAGGRRADSSRYATPAREFRRSSCRTSSRSSTRRTISTRRAPMARARDSPSRSRSSTRTGAS